MPTSKKVRRRLRSLYEIESRQAEEKLAATKKKKKCSENFSQAATPKV